MKTLLITIIIISFVIGQEFIPTLYTSPNRRDYQPQEQKFYSASICKPELYQGCLASVSYLLPWKRIDYRTSVYIIMKVYGVADGCTKILCQNNITNNEFSCNFTFDQTSVWNKIIIDTTAGKDDGITATTFNINFNCPIPKIGYIRDVPKKSYILGACPTNPELLEETIVYMRNGTVKTSQLFDDFAKFYFQICGDGNSYKKFKSTIIGRDDKSSFTAYYCPTPDNTGNFCYPNDSPVGWYDPLASAINIVSASLTSYSDTIAFSIEGWGSYQGNNPFSLGISIN